MKKMQETEGINIKGLINFTKEKKKGILISIFIPAFIALIICLFLPKKYKATAIIIAPEAYSGTGLSTPFGNLGIGAGALSEGMLPSNIIMSIINSETMAQDFIRKFNLIEVYKTDKEKDPMFSAIEILKTRLNVYLSEPEGLLFVSFISHDPILSAKGANFIIKHLDELNEKMRLSNKKPLVEVLDPAKPPVEDCFPKTMITMIVSSFFGLFLLLLFLWFKKELL